MRLSVAGSAPRTVPWVYVSRLVAAVRAAPEAPALLLVAAIIRLALLGAQSGWSDEAATLQVAVAGWRSLVRMQEYDVHPLLYFLLLRSWLLATGVGLLRARLFSTLCDLATLVVLYSLVRSLFDRPTAIVASTLFVLSPIAVWYAATARMYALTELLTLLAIRMLVEAYRTRGAHYGGAFGLCAGLAINADYSGAYLVGAGVLWYLALVAAGHAPPRPLSRGLGVTVVLLIPAVVIGAGQVLGPGLRQLWVPAPTPERVWGTLGDLISQQAPSGAAVAVIGGGLVLGAVVVCGREARRPTHRASYLLLACMVLTPLALALMISLILHPVFITRQVMTALFGLLIVFGRTIVLLWDRSPRWRPLAGLALAALLTLNISSLRVMSATQLTEDWQHAVPYVVSHSSGRTMLAFNPYFFSGPFFLYAGPTANVRVDQPPLAPPRSTDSTVWLIAVYPSEHLSLPRGWSASRLTLSDEHRFANITLFRFTRR